jgi:beta-galactosidase
MITVPDGMARLDILVENGGRVNFQKVLRTERKGITRSVTLDGRELLGWDVFHFPMSTEPAPAPESNAPGGPAYYRGSFTIAKAADTFLDTRGWGKGAIWVNGHALGRFWDIGPQESQYMPAAWLKPGRNTVVVFDLMTPAVPTLSGVPHPIWK